MAVSGEKAIRIANTELYGKERLGRRAKGRKIEGSGGAYQLRDEQSDYGTWHGFDTENTFYWNLAN